MVISQQLVIDVFWLRQSSSAETTTIPVASSSNSVAVVIVELPTLITLMTASQYDLFYTSRNAELVLQLSAVVL